MQNKRFEISKISSFATIIASVLLIFLFSVNGLREGDTLVAYTPLQQFLDNFAIQNNMVSVVINGFAVLIGAIMIGRLGVQQTVYFNRTYLPAVLFVILSMAMGGGGYMLRVYLSALTYILALNHIFRCRNAKRVVGYRWFVCGFWLAISASLYSGAVIGIMAIPIGMMIFRMNSPREYITATMGVVMVGVMIWSGYIIAGVDILAILEGYRDFIALPVIPVFTVEQWAFVGIVVAMTILGIIAMVIIMIRGRADLVKGLLFFVVMMLICGAMAVFTPLASKEGMPIMAIPLAMIMASYFAVPTKRLSLKNALFFVYLAAALALIL